LPAGSKPITYLLKYLAGFIAADRCRPRFSHWSAMA
jgi:hypothetical protein